MTIAYYDIIAIILIAAFLVLRFKFKFASRSIIVLAVSIMVLAAITSGLGAESTANDMTMVAFYSLGAGVLLLSFDYLRATMRPTRKDGAFHRSIARMRDLFDRLRS
ncbi:MAG: hypothetical protein SA339_01125 [Methanomassiliicoccus sp.]|nr:hypothetical protein [Methanomassiliicoccus sp.]